MAWLISRLPSRVTQHFINIGVTAADRIVLHGYGAGALLSAAAFAKIPGLARLAVLQVNVYFNAYRLY